MASTGSEAIPLDDHTTNSTEKVKYSWREKVQIVTSNITVEPIILCFDIPNVISSLAMQHLNLEKACRVDLAYNSSTCDAIAVHNESAYRKEDEADVQKYVATAMAWRNVIQSVIPTILILFLGAWSDRHNRRKPCIILPLLAQLAVTLGLAISTFFFYEMPIVYNVFIEGVPPAITCGWHSLDMAIFAYISSITSIETRTVRIGAVNMLISVAGTVGAAICGVLYYELGFYGCYILTGAAYTFGIFYTSVRLKDGAPDPATKARAQEKGFFGDFFDPAVVKDTVSVAFKNGENNRKMRIFAIMVVVMVLMGPMHGESNVMYMFTRYKFEWSEIDYSIYGTFHAIVHVGGGVFALMLFSKYLQFDDAMLGLLSSMSKIISSIIYAFAPTPLMFYFGSVVEMFNGTSHIAMRSIISKLVPANELGQVYSIFSVVESLTPLLYGPMYSVIYKHTIEVVPGAFFLAGGLLTIPSVVIFYWLHKESQRDLRKAALKKTEEMIETTPN